MIRLLSIIFLIINVSLCYSQSLSVSSFKLLNTDLTANTAGTMEQDQNGEVAALIKVVTTQTGFTFDGGAMGIVRTKQTPGEIWVYVPRGSKKITIKHPQLGVLRDYYYPIAINAARTYEMTLVTGKIQTIVKQTQTFQYVVFQLTPKDAVVELEGQMLNTTDGIASKLMDFGTYNYRVQAPNYSTEAGTITINDAYNKHIVNINLKPNFSVVKLIVDNDAEIWINGERKGIGSWTGELGAGTYIFETKKNSYNSTFSKYKIVANAETQIIHLDSPKPIYGGVDFDSTPGMADIYIDGQKVGQTPMIKSDLLIGEHQYRISREGFADTQGTIIIQEGETLHISTILNNVTQIFVNSSNPDAELYIDGVEQGNAHGYKNISYGKHEILLKAKNWHEYKTTIEVNNPNQSFDFPMVMDNPSRRTITVNHKKLGPVSFDMVYVEGGSFIMGGSTYGKVPVTLGSFYIGETEVTQKLWEAVMGNNPSKFKGNMRPVERVSWNDCKKFLAKLKKLTGLNFRLLTEAEWEFAASGGNKSHGYLYSGSNSFFDTIWFEENSGGCTHNVKTKGPNELGLYDMSGNVEEWVEDFWLLKFPTSKQYNPKGPLYGKNHVIRGGAWDLQDSRGYIRGSRSHDSPRYKAEDLGFRLALD